MFKYLLIFVAISLLVSLSACASKELDKQVSGRVVHVSDGDTLKLLVDGKRLTIRLAGIDAPESKQSYGKESRALLSTLTLNKTIKANLISIDRYGRAVAVLYVGRQSVNQQMIELGAAWFYRDYASWMDVKTKARYDKAESTAKRKKLGLWSGRPVAPWDYRKQQKALK